MLFFESKEVVGQIIMQAIVKAFMSCDVRSETTFIP